MPLRTNFQSERSRSTLDFSGISDFISFHTLFDIIKLERFHVVD